MAEPRVNGGSSFDSLKVSAESVRWEGSLQRRLRREKKKKFNALSVDGRVLCYGGWTKEGKKYMGC
jgi:hypothetical protein